MMNSGLMKNQANIKMNLIKNPINHRQRGMIFGLLKDCGLTNEQLHVYLPAWAGTDSLKSDKCSKAQADKVIEALKNLKNKIVGGMAGLPQSRPGFITPNQLNAINSITSQKNWDVNHLNNFIKHTTGKLSLCELTMKEASAVITGLKKI